MKRALYAAALIFALLILALPAGAEDDRTLTLPSGVTVIEREAFRGLQNVDRIVLPSGVTEIGPLAFAHSSVGDIYVPSTVVRIADDALQGSPDARFVSDDAQWYELFKYTASNGQVTIKKYMGTAASVAVPARIDGLSVTRIGEYAFENNQTLTDVTVPEGVTAIEKAAFRDCVNLTEVSLPQTLTEIGQGAFERACSGLTGEHYFDMPDHVAALGWAPFEGCGAVLRFARGSDSASLFRRNQYIYTYAGESDFRYRWYSNEGERLVGYVGHTAEVEIPPYVWLLDDDVFRGRSELTRVVIPEGVTKINHNTFRDCANLTQVSFPTSLTTLDTYAFYGAGSNAAEPFFFHLGDNIASAQDTSFGGSQAVLVCGLETTTASTISNRGYSFVRADRREETDLRYRWNYFDHVWSWGLYDYVGSAASVRLPDDCANVSAERLRAKVENGLGLVCAQLSDSALGVSRAEMNFTLPGHGDVRYRIIDDVLYVMGCVGAPSTVTIPEAAEYIRAGWDEQIRAGAFRDRTSLTKVVIPEGVTEIDADAFNGCVNLTDITLPDSLRAIGQKAFLTCGQNLASPFYLVLPDHLEDLAGRNGGANAFEDTNAVLVCGKASQTAALLSDRNYVYTCPGEYDFRYRYETYPHNSESGRQVWLVGYEGAGANVTIPSGLYGIRRYDANTTSSYWPTFHGDAFYGNETVTKVVIPEGTAVIEDSAFRGCLNLADITFPSTLRVLKNHAFEQCGKNIQTKHYFVLPDNMEEISTNVSAGWGAFTDIGAGRISCAAGSETARLVSNVYTGHYEGYYHFALKGHEDDGLLYRYQRYETDVSGEYNYRLVLRVYEGAGASVTIPENQGLYRIENGVFSGHSEIRALSIPDGVVEIGQDAFSGCSLWHGTDDENVIGLPNSIKVIGSRAFMDVGAAYTAERFYMVLPNSLDSFDISAVHGCNAVFVAPGGLAQRELYLNWYRYYLTLEDAINRRNLQARDSEDLEQVYYGRA